MRINRFLSQAGLGSRRAVEDLVRAGRVQVNGRAAQLSSRVDPQDEVTVDGRPVEAVAQSRVYLLHKPAGVVTSLVRQGDDPCLADLAPELLTRGRLFYVGRLDRDSSGLLILTNDGDIGHALQHPSQEVWKAYELETDLPLADEDLEAIRGGELRLDDRRCAPARIAHVGPGRVYRMELREGRNRQIRRLMDQLGFTVRRLHRVAVGPLELGDLASGAWRQLSEAELAGLRSMIEPPA